MFINIIECSTYLIAACLPASYPIISRLAPRSLRRRLDNLFNTKAPGKGDYWSSQPQRRQNNDGVGLLPLRTPTYDYNNFSRPDLTQGRGKATRVLGGGENASLDRIARKMGLEDGTELRNGNGIAVTTEIVVTQEERIDRVLGL